MKLILVVLTLFLIGCTPVVEVENKPPDVFVDIETGYDIDMWFEQCLMMHDQTRSIHNVHIKATPGLIIVEFEYDWGIGGNRVTSYLIGSGMKRCWNPIDPPSGTRTTMVN